MLRTHLHRRGGIPDSAPMTQINDNFRSATLCFAEQFKQSAARAGRRPAQGNAGIDSVHHRQVEKEAGPAFHPKFPRIGVMITITSIVTDRRFRLAAAVSCLAAALSVAQAEAFKKSAPPHLKEFEEAMKLTPDIENGRELFKHYCVTCHGPEGWGVPGSGYPQIAGQLKDVIIKQLADFRAGNRDNPIMRAFSSRRSLGGPQEIADVAAYIASLPMTPRNEKGFKLRVEEGKRLYQELCADCHGERGEGDPKKHAPRLHGQHYSYLMRQFNWIRNGRRRNADKKMVEQIQEMTPRQQVAIMSYLSNLKGDNVAKDGWRNPDFDQFDRSWRPAKLR